VVDLLHNVLLTLVMC